MFKRMSGRAGSKSPVWCAVDPSTGDPSSLAGVWGAADVSGGSHQAGAPAAAVRAPSHTHVRLRVLPLVACAAHDRPYHCPLCRPAPRHTLPRVVVPLPGAIHTPRTSRPPHLRTHCGKMLPDITVIQGSCMCILGRLPQSGTLSSM